MRELDVIRTCPRHLLTDVGWLEETIGSLGLTQPGAPAAREGLAIWQSPRQLAPYLVTLAGLEIRSYAEIGVFYGGTFALTVEYLSRFHRLEYAVAIDPVIREPVQDYALEREEVVLMPVPSGDPMASQILNDVRPDLVLIDADHSEEACRADWELARTVARYVAFHDIVEHTCPGVGKVWASLEGGRRWAWTAQYNKSPSVYGIGLIEVHERQAA